MENNYLVRGDKKKKGESDLFPNFNKKKENLCCSLFEVENFLCNFRKVCKYVELYKILK